MRELSLPEDRDEAYCLAGHNYEVIERPNGNVGRLVDPNTFAGNLTRVNGEWRSFDLRQDKKGLYVKQIDADGKPGLLHGNFLEVNERLLRGDPRWSAGICWRPCSLRA